MPWRPTPPTCQRRRRPESPPPLANAGPSCSSPSAPKCLEGGLAVFHSALRGLNPGDLSSVCDAHSTRSTGPGGVAAGRCQHMPRPPPLRLSEHAEFQHRKDEPGLGERNTKLRHAPPTFVRGLESDHPSFNHTLNRPAFSLSLFFLIRRHSLWKIC